MIKTISLSLIVLSLILISCQNKKAPIAQISAEKAHDEQMEKITDLYNSRHYDEFIKLAEIELNKSENDFGFYLALSDAYGNLNNFEKAFYYARKQLEFEPSDYYTMLVMGNYHFVLEKLDSAEFYYNKVLEIRPTYARANLNLAQLFEKQNKKNEAVEQYLKAIELFKENNFKEEVIQYSKQVLSLDPNNKLAKENLGPPYF
jgi:tetratricopeptide (TPR) repeat protein